MTKPIPPYVYVMEDIVTKRTAILVSATEGPATKLTATTKPVMEETASEIARVWIADVIFVKTVCVPTKLLTTMIAAMAELVKMEIASQQRAVMIRAVLA